MINRRDFLVGASSAVALGVAVGVPGVSARSQTRGGLRVRRDIQTMSDNDEFFDQYAAAVRKMHELSANDPRNWRHQALIHLGFCPHGNVNFLPWHRHYIRFYEHICGTLIGDSSFALGYWNWSADQGRIPGPFFANGPLNVTYWNDLSNASDPNWSSQEVTTVGVRGLDPSTGLMDRNPIVFSQRNIDNIKSDPNYGVFRGRLEGSPHGQGHVITGAANPQSGHMYSGMSPLDPIFWLHHCNVDRIWAEWQQAQNHTPDNPEAYNGQFVDGEGNFVNVTANGARDFRVLGYTYETLPAPEAETEGMAKILSIQSGERADIQSFARQEQEASPEVLGRADTRRAAVANTETRFSVETGRIAERLFDASRFLAIDFLESPRIAVREKRILARLIDVEADADAAGLLANIFINCPYLSPATPVTDAHYADTFAFFGAGGHARDFIVDITEPLRAQAKDGRLDNGSIDIQVMAAPLTDAARKAELRIGGIEVITS